MNLISGSDAFLPYVAIAAVRTAALALCAGFGLWLLRPRSVSIRLFVWTGVLYGGFAIPLLGWVAPALRIPMPAKLQSFAEPATQTRVANHALRALERAPHLERSIPYSTETSEQIQAAKTAESVRSESASSINWTTLAAAIYFVIGLLLLLRLAIGLGLARRLVKTSHVIDDPRIAERISWGARIGKLSSVPKARECEIISSPVTIGVMRSVIVLPSDWRRWEEEKLELVIAHEMSHVRRRDALTQCVSLLHRAIFWFSPLSWWLPRHLANLAEQASDDAALSGGVDRFQYAKTLLGFFETANVASGRVWWQGVAMGNTGQAERRMERILSWRGAVAMGMKKSAVVMILAFAIPVVYLVAAATPTRNIQSSGAPVPPEPARANSPVTPPSPARSLPEPAVPPTPENGIYNGGAYPAAPTPPASPVLAGSPEVPPPPAQGQSVEADSDHEFGYAYGFDDEQRFVIVTGKSDSLTMSGSSEDARHVEKLRKQIPGDFIWFQRDEKSYIIRDQATIDRARQLWAPQRELGKKQQELGKQQEALGKQQSELGAKMERVQVKVPDMSAELDKLRAELKQLSSGATPAQVGKLQAEIGELQARIGRVQADGGDEQAKIGAEMAELGEKQGELGKRQGELGRQQGELARQATRQMKELLDDAIKKGLAKPEPELPESSSI